MSTIKDMTEYYIDYQTRKARLEGYKQEYRELVLKIYKAGTPRGAKGIIVDDMPHGKGAEIDYLKAYQDIMHLNNLIEIEEFALGIREEVIGKYKDIVGGASAKYQVAMMRLEGKTNQEIADKLCLTVGRVEHIAAEINKNISGLL